MALTKSVCLCICTLFACSLPAGIILHDNVNGQVAGADTLATPTYDSFSTGDNWGNLSRLQLLLVGGPQANGGLVANLYGDNGTAVGDFLARLGYIADTAVSGSTMLDLALAGNPALPLRLDTGLA